MSNLLLEEKRKKLQNEMKIARLLLEQNINNISPTDYLPSSKELLPDIISNTLSSGTLLLTKLQPVLKQILPRESKINSTLEILKIVTSEDNHDTV